MSKVKILYARFAEDLEGYINNFIEDKEVIDIKIIPTQDNCMALVWYKI